MLRRMLARAAVVIVVAASGVGFFAGAAQAFRITGPYCDGDNQIRVEYRADSGVVVATVIWDDTAPSYAELNIYDNEEDNAVTSVRVDAGSSVVQYESEYGFTYRIYYSVRKWRVVWNGYAGGWISPQRCSP